MKQFSDTKSASEQRHIRRIIKLAASRRSDHPLLSLSQNEAAVLAKLCNLAFRHFPSPIHPGRECIAKSAGVSVSTVKRVLTRLKSLGVISAVGNECGGGHSATRFAVDFTAINEAICGRIEAALGDLQIVRFATAKIPASSYEQPGQIEPAIGKNSRAKMAHGINTKPYTSEALSPNTCSAPRAAKQPPSQGDALPTASVHSIAAARAKREAAKTASLGRGVLGAAL